MKMWRRGLPLPGGEAGEMRVRLVEGRWRRMLPMGALAHRGPESASAALRGSVASAGACGCAVGPLGCVG